MRPPCPWRATANKWRPPCPWRAPACARMRPPCPSQGATSPDRPRDRASFTDPWPMWDRLAVDLGSIWRPIHSRSGGSIGIRSWPDPVVDVGLGSFRGRFGVASVRPLLAQVRRQASGCGLVRRDLRGAAVPRGRAGGVRSLLVCQIHPGHVWGASYGRSPETTLQGVSCLGFRRGLLQGGAGDDPILSGGAWEASRGASFEFSRPGAALTDTHTHVRVSHFEAGIGIAHLEVGMNLREGMGKPAQTLQMFPETWQMFWRRCGTFRDSDLCPQTTLRRATKSDSCLPPAAELGNILAKVGHHFTSFRSLCSTQAGFGQLRRSLGRIRPTVVNTDANFGRAERRCGGHERKCAGFEAKRGRSERQC